MTVIKRIITIFVVIYIYTLVYISFNATKDTSVHSDAILVLGARSYKNGSINPCLEGRVSHGVYLYKKGFADKLIFSGGNDQEDGVSEAETMKEIAIKLGVPKESILLEKLSTSTYENIVLSKQLFQNYEISNAIIVTDVFHSPRASYVAAKQNIPFSLSPAINSSCWQKWKYFQRPLLKEPFAIAYYFISGKI